MQEVQDALKYINDRLNMEVFGLTKPDNEIPAIPRLTADPMRTIEQQKAAVVLAIERFNDGQKAVFNTVVGEILPGVSADHPFRRNSYIYQPPFINLVQFSSELIHAIFGDISAKYSNTIRLNSSAILATTNCRLKSLNDEIIKRFPGLLSMLLSADSVVSQNSEDQKAMELKYPQELLNSINAGSSLPDHESKLNEGFVVMLLRNRRQDYGHLNSTRYVVPNMTKNSLFLRAISGTVKGNS